MFWIPFETVFADTLSKMKHHRLILGHAIRLADFEKLDDIQKRLHKLDIQMAERAVKDSTKLYNARSRGKDAFAGRGSIRGTILNSGIAALLLAFFPYLKLANQNPFP